ncbi:hypothetical protein BKG82_26350 [Mycobacteroides chelonae]|uniref:Uncharacterized protein n=1 Tax=Mycobacteroides chelonae TaxID=1774 RepID=A0A1S1LFX2_MYCCH|nr:hypothetical protein [Mycobacteroides chelonae]OHU47181.1 hypothetical protein BKG82_26350 [Mycobacteroides chelonae]
MSSSRGDAFTERTQRKLDDLLRSVAKDYSVPLSADDTFALNQFFLAQVNSGRWGYVEPLELLTAAVARITALEAGK